MASSYMRNSWIYDRLEYKIAIIQTLRVSNMLPNDTEYTGVLFVSGLRDNYMNRKLPKALNFMGAYMHLYKGAIFNFKIHVCELEWNILFFNFLTHFLDSEMFRIWETINFLHKTYKTVLSISIINLAKYFDQLKIFKIWARNFLDKVLNDLN